MSDFLSVRISNAGVIVMITGISVVSVNINFVQIVEANLLL